jgi:hypothetical protein
MNNLTLAEEAALIMIATMALDYAPEACEVAASPFLDRKELPKLAKALARLRVEKCLPRMHKGFRNGFDSLNTTNVNVELPPNGGSESNKGAVGG